MEAKFSDLKGKTLTHIKVDENIQEIFFTTNEGTNYRMYHDQDCCEDVSIEDICGELDMILNSPILVAEERTSTNEDDDEHVAKGDDYDESYTWTFYELSTNKGSVTIRWYGYSNGYYSESVDFEIVE